MCFDLTDLTIHFCKFIRIWEIVLRTFFYKMYVKMKTQPLISEIKKKVRNTKKGLFSI